MKDPCTVKVIDRVSQCIVITVAIAKPRGLHHLKEKSFI